MLQAEPNPIEARKSAARRQMLASSRANVRRKALSAASWTAGGVLLTIAAALFAYEVVGSSVAIAGVALTVLALWLMVTAVLMVRR